MRPSKTLKDPQRPCGTCRPRTKTTMGCAWIKVWAGNDGARHTENYVPTTHWPTGFVPRVANLVLWQTGQRFERQAAQSSAPVLISYFSLTFSWPNALIRRYQPQAVLCVAFPRQHSRHLHCTATAPTIPTPLGDTLASTTCLHFVW
jgi:hypothetical protein